MAEKKPGSSGLDTKTVKLLPGLTPRPQHHICGREGGEERVKSSSGATFVFIKDCKNASVFVEGKVGKVLVENGKNLAVYITNHVVGGIVEVLRCSDLTINLDGGAEVPVLQVDDSSVVNVHIQTKSQLQSIYYIRCCDIFVFLENQIGPDNPSGTQALPFHVDNPSEDAEVQRVGHWDSLVNGANFISEVVVRDGIFPSTASLKRAAEEREEQAMARLLSMIMKNIRIERPPSSATTSSTPSNKSASVGEFIEAPVSCAERGLDMESHRKPAASKPTAPEESYGRQHEDEKKEYFDSADVLEEKVQALAEWLRECDHCIIFTGAGISTSTGIPDFRSGMNTVLKTGPGAWELRDKGVARPSGSQTKSTLQAIPSITHMAIVELQRRGLVKFVVSQNTDGLHLRSGLEPSSLAELHGNANLEKCQRCSAKYLRDFSTRANRHVHDHSTGRLCPDPQCGGQLLDSIINFGENLPSEELEAAYANANKADLCISLGSSLTVSPANDIPATVSRRGHRTAIVNLQRTPLHSQCSMPLFAMCDDVMKALMRKLDIPIPEWRLRRRVRVSLAVDYEGHTVEMIAKGLDLHRNIPYSLFTVVDFSCGLRADSARVSKSRSSEPFSCSLCLPQSRGENAGIWYSFKLAFAGHYCEPNFVISGVVQAGKRSVDVEYILSYDPLVRKWDTEAERIF